MTARTFPVATPSGDTIQSATDPVEAARRHIVATALKPTGERRVGLELEFHLVDLADPARRPDWDEVGRLVDALPPMPSGSRVTLEPGGQVELSTPPADDVEASVTALQADRAVLRTALAAAGFGAAPLGTDPARPVRRINPSGRYVAMERHFAAMGCLAPGAAMMTATAALQVNLDAGPIEQWPRRLELVRRLGPVLVALSACSPWLADRSSGWHSMRQQIWHGIDHSRSDPVPGDEPGEAWADYALDAAVMLVRDEDAVTPMTRRVSFRSWLAGDAPIERRPTTADLDYHLTTLFPPVRPRGYLEIRCLDAQPDRWWPALAVIVATLIDDDAAADRAFELAEPVRDTWLRAAQDGLSDRALRTAVQGCVEVAAEHAPDALRSEVESYAELIMSGRTPGDELRDRIEAVGPLQVLKEETNA